jgi:predicted CXXCH cytochrome family protein
MRNKRTNYGIAVALGVLAIFAAHSQPSDEPKRLDPAVWGSDHVGKPVPEYTTGDECLFCHREKIGTGWGANRHNLTIRPADDAPAALEALRKSDAKEFVDAVKFVMGDQHLQRFLKPAKEYGKFDLLSAEWAPPRDGKQGRLVSANRPHWDAAQFADSCAGCHTTAVDPKEKAFSAVSLDCFTCHGSVPAEHAKKPELAHLSPKRKDEARVVTSICAQCHVRTGKSKETGRPYSTNFVAGDNLFRDFRTDFSDEALKVLSSADRHVVENVRDVVVFGREAVTCLSCHDVHGRSSKKHHRVAEADSCLTCHNADGPKRDRKPFSNFSKTCGYSE